MHDGHGLVIGAGSEIEEGAVGAEPLEMRRQLMAGGEPEGPGRTVVSAQVVVVVIARERRERRETAGEDNVAEDSRRW